MIDLRSDTVTKPTEGMRKAMYTAEVGDDVFKEDPTVNAFQEKVAALFGFECGLFVPSGTMSNQLAINILTQPGDEVIIDTTGHIYNYESAGGPFLSGIQYMILRGEQGILTPEIIKTGFRGHNDWDPNTSVISLENTTNKGGGAYYSKENLLAIKKLAYGKKISVHLDGARIWNASIASKLPLSFFGTVCETISVCFSKGLGAPVGSMLLCSNDRYRNAMRKRKMWGGGMRQVGILAAAANYALDHHFSLLEADHIRAKKFAEFVNEFQSFYVDPNKVFTNIVLFDCTDKQVDEVLVELREHGIGMVPFGPKTIRAVFHHQVNDEALEKVKQVMHRLYK